MQIKRDAVSKWNKLAREKARKNEENVANRP